MSKVSLGEPMGMSWETGGSLGETMGTHGEVRGTSQAAVMGTRADRAAFYLCTFNSDWEAALEMIWGNQGNTTERPGV